MRSSQHARKHTLIIILKLCDYLNSSNVVISSSRTLSCLFQILRLSRRACSSHHESHTHRASYNNLNELILVTQAAQYSAAISTRQPYQSWLHTFIQEKTLLHWIAISSQIDYVCILAINIFRMISLQLTYALTLSMNNAFHTWQTPNAAKIK